MPHIASSFWQPGRRGGGRRWLRPRTGRRKRASKGRGELPTRPEATRRHARQPQPQQEVSGAASRTATRRLPSMAEEEEEAEEEEGAQAEDMEDVEGGVEMEAVAEEVGEEEEDVAEEEQMAEGEQLAEKEEVREKDNVGKEKEEKEEQVAESSSPAAAAAVGSNARGVSGAAPATDRGAYRTASRSFFGFFAKMAPPAAAHSSVPHPIAATAAAAPASGAPSGSIELGHERDGKGAEEEAVVGKENTGKEQEEEVAEESSVAAAAALSSHVRGVSGVAPATNWGARRTESRGFFGFRKTAPAAAARVPHPIAAAASAAPASGAPSASIEKDGEGGKDREEEGEGKMGESAGETTLAIPGNGDEEYGSPVPAKFRPEGRKDDALCSWKLDLLDDENQSVLGAGTFGTVCAVKTKGGLPMAMKIMAKSTPAQERDTKNEVEVLEACSTHPNVVEFYGCIRTPTRLYILMPKAPWDLACMIERAGVHEDQAASIVRKLVSAVEFLHGRGIVHRDIKPGNILIDGNNVFLADFGLAVTAPNTLLSGESACGTLPYMAPELLQRQPYGSAVDIWATGVVAYEMLHRTRPFTGQLDVQSHNDGGAGSAGGSRSGSGGGSVSDSNGSVVTGCMESFGPTDTRDCTNREGVLRRKILLGEYVMDPSYVGSNGMEFISQLLSTDPKERATAVEAAEHSWVGGSSTVPRRRLKARLEVATATAKRAISAVQRLQARVQPSSDLRRAAANVTSMAVATEAAVSAVSEVGQMAAMLGGIVAMGEEAKCLEETAAGATKSTAEGAKDKGEDAQTAFRKVEEVVVTVEMFAREAETPIAEATETVDLWEKAVRQEALP